jgi:hypothetical protein
MSINQGNVSNTGNNGFNHPICVKIPPQAKNTVII